MGLVIDKYVDASRYRVEKKVPLHEYCLYTVRYVTVHVYVQRFLYVHNA